MKFFKIALTCFALGATALNAFSQSVGTGTSPGSSASYVSVLVPLPQSVVSGASGSNFYSGWQLITSSTNIQGSLYTNNLNNTGLPGFYTATNIVTYTNTSFWRAYIPKQERIALEWVGLENNGGGVATTNIFTLAKSVSGGQPDTVSEFPWTIVVNSTNPALPTVAVTNLPADFIGGEGWIYVVQQTNNSPGINVTNVTGGISWGSKPGAP